MQRQPRLHDESYLRFLRGKPCCVCGKPPPSEACHIRMGSIFMNKPMTGLQSKPDDKWCVPMCADHHREQHSGGELAFWAGLKREPFSIAVRLYREYGGDGGRAKGPRKIKPRVPREQRKKIQSRGFQ